MGDTWLQVAEVISCQRAESLIQAFLSKIFLSNFVADNVK